MDLKFSPSSSQEAGSFRLLELPPELCKLIESSVDNTPYLSIKGHASEDAVLCTADKTYSLRSVVLSNTVIVATASKDAGGGVDIRDQLHEIIELVPAVPKLHKLTGLLRGLEYDEGDEDRVLQMSHYSYEQARNETQASEAEFNQGLKDRRILVLDGQLRPITPAHLSTILELLLNYLVSLGLSHQAAPVEELVSTLADEHEIPRQVTEQVVAWFGDVNEGLWSMDANAVTTEIGLGILRHHKHEPISNAVFMARWKKTVGDSFEAVVQLSLLSGNYLRNTSLASDFDETLTYFPSSGLPIEPAARFAELFLTRPRWKSEEIEPFLSDIAINSKERDKLLLKYARALTGPEGVWYTARVSFNN
ncbi:hypothetical protein BV22DRAFT_1040301 [Leucogyrophana mollusca]|uniref:Uncharacterized protein n=1 Tax=Leucogyrophana mollusca TaxID=85980 RepID=A0ACB8B5D1_9AGAM|nr:hypothetical protein BV22DRAFT_1040301 [Leucogyrophana mollusca]